MNKIEPVGRRVLHSKNLCLHDMNIFPHKCEIGNRQISIRQSFVFFTQNLILIINSNSQNVLGAGTLRRRFSFR